MKIAVDAMGGDYAPKAVVDGAILAAQEFGPEVEIQLIGKKEIIEKLLSEHNFNGGNISVFHADEVIEMHEHPAKAVPAKPNASINIGFKLLATKQTNAFCSAGNTGAMMVGSLFGIKTIEGVLRPAIVGFVPKLNGSTGLILDIGANAECKPEFLDQFAEIGTLYSKHVLGISMPKVALMNIGEEEQKGTSVLQAAHQLLKNNTKITFIGNIEGRDLFNDKADVIVCDGFTGNVILKMAENFYDLAKHQGISNAYFDKFNYESVGGSPILGVNGNVIIGHGSSSPTAIKNMIRISLEMAKADIGKKIKEAYSIIKPN
jgi:phosphate acyltransferase